MLSSASLSVSDRRNGFERSPTHRMSLTNGENTLFGQQFIQQLVVAARPHLEALIREVLAEKSSSFSQVLCVNYAEAGWMIGTTYEGIRKLVRTGKLTAVSRSGRHRGIAVDELKSYIERNRLR
jgi:hypothetical protein